MPKVTKIHDNIVTIEGKYNYTRTEFFKLSPEADGIVLTATPTSAELLVIGDPSSIKNKSVAKPIKSKLDKIDVKDGYFGTIISPFGSILFPENQKEGKVIGTGMTYNEPPELLDRIALSEPLETGMIVIDSMIPIGRGQRELIIGDRVSGKTTIALNTIINQKKTNVKTIYVSVGQKGSSIINSFNTLKNHDAHKNTIFIFSNPDSSAEQFFSPMIGMAMAEALAYKGEDVLIIIDDLSKHANIYREISLSIGKSPGREAYPTDIFYRHASLLERAGRFNDKYNNGSITCLPIVELVQGDIASLIPSNVISITDGQIFTSIDMFNNGEYPAIDIGLSVSRTGSSVQNKYLRNASKDLKSEWASLSDIKKFADMSIDLSDELKVKIEDWKSINNMLIQHGNEGLNLEQMVIMLELYKMRSFYKLQEKRKFCNYFKNFCENNTGAKLLIEKLKKGKYNDNTETFRKDLKAVFIPFVKTASGIMTSIISEKEFKEYKGGK